MNTSKNFKIIFTTDCKKEIDDIYHYISQKLFAYNSAKKLMKKLEDIIENLKYMPESYPIIKEYEELNLKFTVGLPAEDAIFTTYCFIKSKKVFYIPEDW